MEKIPYRIDFDDRDMSMGRKIREAEREWVPYILVLGAKEMAEGCVSVRTRDGKQRKMAVAELLAEIEPKMTGKPFLELPLPRHTARRPIFVG